MDGCSFLNAWMLHTKKRRIFAHYLCMMSPHISAHIVDTSWMGLIKRWDGKKFLLHVFRLDLLLSFSIKINVNDETSLPKLRFNFLFLESEQKIPFLFFIFTYKLKRGKENGRLLFAAKQKGESSVFWLMRISSWRQTKEISNFHSHVKIGSGFSFKELLYMDQSIHSISSSNFSR